MVKIGYLMAKVKEKIFHNHEILYDYYRRVGGVKIGKDCLLCSSPMTREPYLINIGNNVTVSTNVTFVTHDNSIKLLYPKKSDVFGKIIIGNNCFIGENVTILYGVTLADNIIVAAGSVVTKSFRNSNIIIGGNPAHIINTWDKFSEKIKDNVITRKEMENCKERDSSFLISYADDLKNIIKNALVKSETRDWIYAGEEEEFKDMIDTLSKKIM